MGSVNLNDGTGWWKRCMNCGEWTNYDDLVYEPESEAFPYGRDLCPVCGPNLPNQSESGMMIVLNTEAKS